MAQRLVDEGDPATASLEPTIVSAAKGVLDRAFKVQDSIKVEEEMARLRAIVDAIKAGGSNPAPAPAQEAQRKPMVMTQEEQAEACRLRVAWLSALGHSPADIDTSLRYNRPHSVAEEQYFLDLVLEMLAEDKDDHVPHH